jgi:hypothetical protein
MLARMAACREIAEDELINWQQLPGVDPALANALGCVRAAQLTVRRRGQAQEEIGAAQG